MKIKLNILKFEQLSNFYTKVPKCYKNEKYNNQTNLSELNTKTQLSFGWRLCKFLKSSSFEIHSYYYYSTMNMCNCVYKNLYWLEMKVISIRQELIINYLLNPYLIIHILKFITHLLENFMLLENHSDGSFYHWPMKFIVRDAPASSNPLAKIDSLEKWKWEGNF